MLLKFRLVQGGFAPCWRVQPVLCAGKQLSGCVAWRKVIWVEMPLRKGFRTPLQRFFFRVTFVEVPHLG